MVAHTGSLIRLATPFRQSLIRKLQTENEAIKGGASKEQVSLTIYIYVQKASNNFRAAIFYIMWCYSVYFVSIPVPKPLPLFILRAKPLELHYNSGEEQRESSHSITIPQLPHIS